MWHGCISGPSPLEDIIFNLFNVKFMNNTFDIRGFNDSFQQWLDSIYLGKDLMHTFYFYGCIIQSRCVDSFFFTPLYRMYYSFVTECFPSPSPVSLPFALSRVTLWFWSVVPDHRPQFHTPLFVCLCICEGDKKREGGLGWRKVGSREGDEKTLGEGCGVWGKWDLTVTSCLFSWCI